jgi:hypothetical protein
MSKIKTLRKPIGILLLIFQFTLYIIGRFKFPDGSDKIYGIYQQVGYVIGFNLYGIAGLYLLFRHYKSKKNHQETTL